MKSLKNLPNTLVKSTLLSATVFWVILAKEIEFHIIMIFSLVPVFIVCSLVICITIVPFFIFEDEKVSNQRIFKKHFPFYTIVMFGIACFGIMKSDYDIYVTAFMTSAFFSLSYAWIWLCKQPSTNKSLK
jgi:hypothetical protein